MSSKQGNAQHDAEHFRGGHAHNQRPHQARAGSHRDRIDIPQLDARCLTRTLQGGLHRLQVGTAGHLRHRRLQPRLQRRHRLGHGRAVGDVGDQRQELLRRGRRRQLGQRIGVPRKGGHPPAPGDQVLSETD